MEKEIEMSKERLAKALIEAICCWEDEGRRAYMLGIRDGRFIAHVCEKLDITEDEYEELMGI